MSDQGPASSVAEASAGPSTSNSARSLEDMASNLSVSSSSAASGPISPAFEGEAPASSSSDTTPEEDGGKSLAIPAYGSNLGPPCPAAHPVRPALAHIAPVPSNALSATAASNLANGASNGIPAAQSRPAQGTGGPSPYATGGPSQSRGGPPPRLASGGPGAGATGGPVAGTGGPGRRTAMGGVGGVNERTRQMATTKLPPGLQAKLAAMANRSSSSNSNLNVLGPDQRLDSASILGPSAGGGPFPPSGGPRAGGGGPQSRPTPSFGGPGMRATSSPAGAGIGAHGSGPSIGAAPGGRRKPGLKLSDMGISTGAPNGAPAPAGEMGSASPPGRRAGPPGKLSGATTNMMSTPFSNFSKIVDPSGRLNFGGKAVLHASGVEFGNGTSFKINMEDLELLDELGKGNYGTVRKVLHTRTKVHMAMKEIRLELDDSKLNAIIMELDILHRAIAPEIVEFYGAFFIESCVYYCMEFMDAGSLDKLYDGQGSVPEDVLARITGSMVRGLRFLKDELQIIHRDVKPTNVLVNRRGQVKLCDFGVSGQLEKSLAKTNIGCQSYMAPERIKGESQNMPGTYTVSSDVWSLGLSMVEMTMGTYPYPPETYSNVFAQLQAIVHGDAPQLPPEGYSDTARDFVAACLEKVPERRATYGEMLEHPFLKLDAERGDKVDMAGWVEKRLDAKKAKAAQQDATVDPSVPPSKPMTAPPP